MKHEEPEWILIHKDIDGFYIQVPTRFEDRVKKRIGKDVWRVSFKSWVRYANAKENFRIEERYLNYEINPQKLEAETLNNDE
jgi:hypothetical protein